MQRIGVYARVSTARQAEAQSTEQQLERLRAHVAAHAGEGWDLREEHVFRDDGFSGARLQRPGLDRLRDAVAAAALDRVLVTAPDRLARNYVHQMVLLEELERHDCQVDFLERPMSQDPHDHLLLQIRSAVAEYERTLIAERMRRGRLRKLQAGVLLPWTRPPYALRLDPERPRDPAGVRVEEAEAAVVRELFAQYLEPGGSLAGLAKHLYALGVPTPTGKRCWHPNTIRLILTNPAYTGQVYAGRRRVRRAQLRWSALRPVGHHGESATPSPPETWLAVAPIPALVSQDQFDQAQAKLAQNQQFARRHNTAHSYLLRALVSCGVCQLGCVGRWSHPGYAYYCCRGKTHPIQSGRQQRCRARFIPAAQLDELVWGDLCDLLTHPQSLHHALERAHGGHWLPQELQARREQVRRGRQQLEAQLDRLSEAYLQGVMPLAEYRRRRPTLEQRQHALARQIEQLETQARDHQALIGVVASVDALCQRVQAGLAQATFEQKRHLVELLIDRVIVTNGDVEIRYVIPTTRASEHVRFCHLRTDYFDHVATGIDGFVKEEGPSWSNCPLRTLVVSLWNGVLDLPLAQPPPTARIAVAFVGDEPIRARAWSPPSAGAWARMPSKTGSSCVLS
jgi:site-specific DNA recombinase